MVEALIFFAVGAGVWLYVTITFRRIGRAQQQHDASLHALPRTAINDLAVGARVRIVGKAIGSHTVKSPYGGTPCLAFHCESSATIEYGAADGYTISECFDAPSQRDVLPFSVDDGTGEIAVAIDHAQLDLSRNELTKDQIEGQVFGAKMIARDTTSTSYTEHILVADEQVGVLGVVREGPDGKLYVSGSPDAPLIVSNLSAAIAP